MSREYRECRRCVLDTSATDISFDSEGNCNYCSEFLRRFVRAGQPTNQGPALDELIDRIKREHRSKRYDCVVGVSGGVDSSWVLVRAIELGLRPLAVHMDNGWDSELAQNNIANLIRGLGVDLHTHVIEWGHYRDLMRAFFDADVLDIELLYDNAMLKVNFEQAARFGVRTFLTGSNQATEGILMPTGWNWMKFDRRNIKGIARSSGVRLQPTFPAIGVAHLAYFRLVRRITAVPILDFGDYDKESSIRHLESNFGYKRYPYKHYESIFTRFYQGVILPRKFGIDKRRLHLSNLVVTGQLTRDEALRELEGSPMGSSRLEEIEFDYVIKKLGYSRAEFDDYLARPGRSHADFPSEKWVTDLLKRGRSIVRRSA